MIGGVLTRGDYRFRPPYAKRDDCQYAQSEDLLQKTFEKSWSSPGANSSPTCSQFNAQEPHACKGLSLEDAGLSLATHVLKIRG